MLLATAYLVAAVAAPAIGPPTPAHAAVTTPAVARHAAGSNADGVQRRRSHAAARNAKASDGAGPSAPKLVARYGFNGRSSSILDESGHGHTLAVVSAHGGVVRPVVHGQGSALAFPSRCSAAVCPHVALQSPSRADLNPGARDFAFGADVLLERGQTSEGENIVQKGYSAGGSQWKLQVDGAAGRPSCVLVDDRRPGDPDRPQHCLGIADGRWHLVLCRRAGTALTVFVDGVARGSTTVPAQLSVSNDEPLSIGAKGAFADNDQFNGALDNVWVQIG